MIGWLPFNATVAFCPSESEINSWYFASGLAVDVGQAGVECAAFAGGFRR